MEYEKSDNLKRRNRNDENDDQNSNKKRSDPPIQQAESFVEYEINFEKYLELPRATQEDIKNRVLKNQDNVLKCTYRMFLNSVKEASVFGPMERKRADEFEQSVLLYENPL
jgi:hypothetical protein